MMLPLEKKLEEILNEAERKAWDSLSRYKFQMFGYWAAIWIHLNRIGGFKRRNPFSGVVGVAKYRMVKFKSRMPTYASNTQVSSDRSRAEIEKTLARYGADQFIYGWQEEMAMIGFRMKSKMVRF